VLLLYKLGGELRCSTELVVLLLYKPGGELRCSTALVVLLLYKPGVNSGAPLMTLFVLL